MSYKKQKNEEQKKEKYETPKITTEQLIAFGAICNGRKFAGRKQITAAPDRCQSTKLKS